MHSPSTESNIAIVSSSFYTVRNNDGYELELVKNALSVLDINKPVDFTVKYHNFGNARVIIVPGAMEIPQAANWLISNREIDGILAVGCVIKGETAHYDHVCHTAISGIAQVAMQSKVPITTAIVTAHSDKQAQERCFAQIEGKPMKNLGFHGMKALLEIIELKGKINEDSN